MLHEFVTANRDEIIDRCRRRVAARSAPPPTRAELDHGVPMFLDQLVNELRDGPTPNADIAASASEHGSDFLRQGYTIAQLVYDYGDVCQAITELAIERDARISANDFRALNRSLDDAIAGSVTAYSNQEHSSAHDGVTRDSAQLVALVRGVRSDLIAVRLAFKSICSGAVGLSGETARMVERGLTNALEGSDRLLAEVRVLDTQERPPQ